VKPYPKVHVSKEERKRGKQVRVRRRGRSKKMRRTWRGEGGLPFRWCGEDLRQHEALPQKRRHGPNQSCSPTRGMARLSADLMTVMPIIYLSLFFLVPLISYYPTSSTTFRSPSPSSILHTSSSFLDSGKRSRSTLSTRNTMASTVA
jgi:hypothetical protein